MKYQLVTNRARCGEIFSDTAAIEVRGFRFTGGEGGNLREELRGQPKFDGLCGPMWGGTTEDGEPIIRYEDWGTYELLSR